MPEPEYEDVYRSLCRPETAGGFSRRRFLQGSLAGAGTLLARSWLLERGTAAFAAPIGPADGVLVVILMGGGNDGLNTIVPFGDSAYFAKRPLIALPGSSVLPVGPGVGFHPSLVRLKRRFDAGQVAVIRGVGFAGSDLSHFASMATWMKGAADTGPPTSGWLGRWLDGMGSPDLLRAVAIGNACPLHLVGQTTQGTALPVDLSAAFGLDRSDPSDGRMFDAVSALGRGSTGYGRWADGLGRVGSATMTLAATVTPSYTPALPPGDLTSQLVLGARLINANLGVRVLSCSFGSFDTHADELVGQAALLDDFDRAVQSFYDTLGSAWADRVTLMTFSEFGRRVDGNNSRGTDHGTANNVFVIGSKVRGGLVGDQPSLSTLDDNGDLVPTIDFRSVYATVLDRWMAGDSTATVGASYAPLPLFVGAPGGPPPPTPRPPPVTVVVPPPPPVGAAGYSIITSGGQVLNFGRAGQYSAVGTNSPIVAAVATPSRQGMWLAGADGGVFSFGDAPFRGSMGGKRLNAPIVGLAPTPSGNGYWLLGRDGGIFSFGDATFFGSTGAMRLNAPVVGLASAPNGRGYWFVASDGGVFAFGPDARYHGSMGANRLNSPVVGMAASPTGNGYWLAAADGGVFTFGDAGFFGSTGAQRLNQPIVALCPTASGLGYWFVAADGGVFAFGDATFQGSLGAHPPDTPVVAMVA